MPVATDIPTALAIAPDGTVWFTIDFADAVGRDPRRQDRSACRRQEKRRAARHRRGCRRRGVVHRSDRGPDLAHVARAARSSRFRLARRSRAWDAWPWRRTAPSGSPRARPTAFTRLKDGVLTRHVPNRCAAALTAWRSMRRATAWGTLQSGNQFVRIAPDGEITEYRNSDARQLAERHRGRCRRQRLVPRISRQQDRQICRRQVHRVRRARRMGADCPGIAVAPDGVSLVRHAARHAIGRLRDGQFKMFELPREDARPYTLAADAEGQCLVRGYQRICRHVEGGSGEEVGR